MGLVNLFSRAQDGAHRVYNYLKKVCLPLDTKVKSFAAKSRDLLANVPSWKITFNYHFPLMGNWEKANRTVSQAVNVGLFAGIAAIQFSLWWLSPLFDPTAPLAAVIIAPLLEELAREISYQFSFLIAFFEGNEGHLFLSLQESFTLRWLFHVGWNALSVWAPEYWFSKVIVLGVRLIYTCLSFLSNPNDKWWHFFATRTFGQFLGIVTEFYIWVGILPAP